MIKKIFFIFMIFIFIQVLNQILIFVGSGLEKTILSDVQNSRKIVGVVQQLIQALTGIVLFKCIFKKPTKDLGINTWNWRVSLKYFTNFAVIWILVILLYIATVYFFLPSTWISMRSIELPHSNTIIATLIFESFFPGFGEEILFRGLIINILAGFVFPEYKEIWAAKLGVIVLSSFYFSTAHIYFTLPDFQITHIDCLQLSMAFGCGVFYSIMFLETKSLFAPFLAHNFSNTTSTICGYIISGI